MPLEMVDQSSDQPGKGSEQKPVTFEIVVNGRRETFDLTNPEHAETLRQRAQMGTNYSQRVAELNKEKSDFYRAKDPLVQFDEELKKDPALEALVAARLRGDPLPLHLFGVKPAGANGAGDGDRDGDRTDVADIESRIRRDSEAKFGQAARLLERLNERMDRRELADAEREDVNRIKTHPVFKGWVKEDHITLAKEAQQRRGGSVYANFLLLFEHEIPRIVESRTLDELPPEVRRTALTRETAPLVVDGLTLTEERLAEIRSDPDLYAKYKGAIRAHKRKMTGKLEYPR